MSSTDLLHNNVDCEAPYAWQSQQWEQLQAARAAGRLAHAFLFTGQEGLGQCDFALSFAASLLCQENEAGKACGRCHRCHLLKIGVHPDFKLIQPEGSGKIIKIDQIRRLIESLSKTIHTGSHRV